MYLLIWTLRHTVPFYSSYSLEDGDAQLMKDGSVHSFNVIGLLSNTRYYYRVRSYNSQHTSGYSDIIDVVTLPIPPLALEADDVNDIALLLSGNPVIGIVSYRIEIGMIFHLIIHCLMFLFWYFLFCERGFESW